jgi:hypothetical protein
VAHTAKPIEAGHTLPTLPAISSVGRAVALVCVTSAFPAQPPFSSWSSTLYKLIRQKSPCVDVRSLLRCGARPSRLVFYKTLCLPDNTDRLFSYSTQAPESDEPHSKTPPGVQSWWHAHWGRFKRRAFRSEMLLYWTLFGVAIGAVVGSVVSWLQPSERVTELIGELSACIFEPQSFWNRRS